MAEVVAPLADGRRARIRFTGASDGDLRLDAPGRDRRRASVAPGRWTALRQVHGSHVVVVHAPGEHHGAEADAAVTATAGAPIAVQTADCAPIALIAEGGAIGVVHAGWRGLLGGVVETALARLRTLAAGPYRAVLGPCIHPECYEFGEGDLAPIVARFGPAVRGVTSTGTPALDLPTAVRAALDELDVPLDVPLDVCTACDTRWFSHRARGDLGRQVVVAWIEGA